MKKIAYSLTGAAGLLPYLALAQGAGVDTSAFEDLVAAIGRIIDMLIPIVFALGLLAFFWGLVQYIFAAGDPAKAKSGKSIMIYGVIALFVMSAIWGLTRFLGDIFGISDETSVDVPYIDATGGGLEGEF